LFPLFYFLVGANIFIFAGIFLIYHLSFE
jgi:hypothetical protein